MSWKLCWALAAVPLVAAAQITVTGVSTTATQAILQYSSPVQQACSLKVADMNRSISIVSGVSAMPSVTITSAAPHGLLPGAVIYVEGSGVVGWDGWQTIDSVPTPISFTFSSATQGTSTGGAVGVLTDDVNPTLFPAADLDTRPGNLNTGQLIPGGAGGGQIGSYSGANRVFVIGHRDAPLASDGNRYTRALQANSRHRYALTCGSQSSSGEFNTQNPPLGDTHNEGAPIDRSKPGQYAYPTIQWSNRSQALIDPAFGLRSVRATAPTGAASTTQNFVTALDLNSAWRNPSGPLATWGGAATFTGPCSSGSCALLLRADGLTLPGGAGYNSAAASLDWVAVTISNASINAPRSGDDAKIVACLTVDGATCKSGTLELALTTTPATYTLGTKALMDLWQGAGPPAIASADVSASSGTVNYTASTRQVVLAGGNLFSVKWGAGSRITIAGSEYPIASVQNETRLTLSAGPSSDLNGVPYSAHNFGALVWKKTPMADQVSIGYATFQYGSSSFAYASTGSTGSCSDAVVTVNGVPGYNCFASDLYWISADGSDVRDLGLTMFQYGSNPPNVNWSNSWNAGGWFDPLDGNTWYAVINYAWDNSGRMTVIKVHYTGSHAAGTPGQTITDCALNNNVQPCLQFTVMQPNKSDSVSVSGPGFNPAYAASGYQMGYLEYVGIGANGDMVFYTRESGQDTKGWIFVYTLGDRTPVGTGPNSIRPIAAMSSYQTAPCSWCVIHSMVEPSDSGWLRATTKILGGYTMTLEAALSATPTTCPTNSLGVTGANCSTVTVSGEPLNGGVPLQPTQVGDVFWADNEPMRIVSKLSSTSLVVQRGYVYNPYEGTHAVATHATNATLTMDCGSLNRFGGATTIWDYKDDPYGRNSNGATILMDPNEGQAHEWNTPTVTINSGGAWYNTGPATCPVSVLGGSGTCYIVRLGHLSTIATAPMIFVAMAPPFAGVNANGTPNQVDSHPGFCSQTQPWCFDSRPMDGGPNLMVGSSGSPFVNVTGQLWKFAGAQSVLHRKSLNTVAYAGNYPLVDISGPSSSIASDSSGSYEYCYALAAGECYSGSSAGDIYVNAPYVSYPYCNYPGIARMPIDTNSICVGDLSAYAGNLVQVGVAAQDIFGALSRRLGPNYAKWNMMDVYWTLNGSSNGLLGFSQVLWLDGVRTENLITVIPPYPAPDSISRGTFIPISVTTAPPPSLMVNDAIVEFGYAENGDPGGFFCTSRQESCVAVSGAVDASTPFFYEQVEAHSGARCSAGCTVAIPALPQRVLYYRWKYRDAFGKVIATSEVRATATP